MGQIRHGSATHSYPAGSFLKEKMPGGHARCPSSHTAIHRLAGYCAAMSREAQASNAALSRELGINVKTVAKWRKRDSVHDAPKEMHSTVLSIEEEAVVVAFRRHTLLPLDDCLYALQPTIPHLTRPSVACLDPNQGRNVKIMQ